jgi:hypothetical protein
MSAILLVVFVLPFVWSAVLYLARRFVFRSRGAPNDGREKWVLLLMLCPVVLGVGVLAVARLFAVHVSLPLPLAPAGDIDGGFIGEAVAVAPRRLVFNPLPLVPTGLMAIYALVAIFLAVRLLTAYTRIAVVCSRATPDSGLGQGVRVSERTGIAMAWGRATILLPQRLLPHLSTTQTELIIRHERAHLARRDPLYFAALAWLDVCLWFNPFVRAQTRRCRLAAELDCDARVTGALPHMRETYAESLIMALKHAAGNARQCVPAAFSPAESGDYRMRISEIMHPEPKARKTRLLIVAGAVLLAPVALAQLAWSQGPVRHSVAIGVAAVAAPAPFFTVMPVEGRLSSGFGMRMNPVTHETSLHEGVDIASPIGTPVRAPAGGRVIRADLAQPWFGKVLEIDHGNGLVTNYKHLGDFKVKVGDTVMAGQEVAKSGNTGRSTGPHTHIALYENGKAVDPVGRIPLPKS